MVRFSNPLSTEPTTNGAGTGERNERVSPLFNGRVQKRFIHSTIGVATDRVTFVGFRDAPYDVSSNGSTSFVDQISMPS